MVRVRRVGRDRARLAWDIVLTVVMVVAVFAAAFVVESRWLDARLEQRVEVGVRTEARVVEASTIYVTGPPHPRLTVAYSFEGRHYRAPLMWSVPTAEAHLIEKGDRVWVYVDPSSPDLVATRSGGGSEGWLLVLPRMVASFLALAIIILMLVRIRNRRLLLEAGSRTPDAVAGMASRFRHPNLAESSRASDLINWFSETRESRSRVDATGDSSYRYRRGTNEAILRVLFAVFLVGLMTAFYALDYVNFAAVELVSAVSVGGIVIAYLLGPAATVRLDASGLIVNNPFVRYDIPLRFIERVEVDFGDMTVGLRVVNQKRVNVAAFPSVDRRGSSYRAAADNVESFVNALDALPRTSLDRASLVKRFRFAHIALASLGGAVLSWLFFVALVL